eukprot:MONOS_13010.1-p1 / transcript=MONOS_13010.1 / gene=MONOS_13010 / organism=Monocercomonoides_exilis_PA203 / gene_product=unspecified product / transcript_product=unspecified product / location=Mono_scaffold00766:12161-12494(+) / protein_length=73 / sequence_SO=supercontig / SO=protein_coding / is_pseudo=false
MNVEAFHNACAQYQRNVNNLEILKTIAHDHPFRPIPSELESYDEQINLSIEHLKTKHTIEQLQKLIEKLKDL